MMPRISHINRKFCCQFTVPFTAIGLFRETDPMPGSWALFADLSRLPLSPRDLLNHLMCAARRARGGVRRRS
jgi:hypothetical protein